MGIAKLIAAVAATVAALAASLLAPDIARAYEVHVSITGAGRVYETTNANLVGKECSPWDWNVGLVSPQETQTGVVGAECWPGSPNSEYGWGWTVRYVAEAKPGYSFVQWQSDGGSDPVLCDTGSAGTYQIPYGGSACQFRTYKNLQVQAVFEDTTNPAMTSLRGPSQVVTGPAGFTFSAADDPTFRKFECRVVGVHDWQDCSSGHTEDPPTGTYTFEVRAVDWSGNRSAESTWRWEVDKAAPGGTVSINGGAAHTRNATVNLTLSATDQGTGVSEMRFSHDGQFWTDWEAYATSKSWTLLSGDGTKTVYVQYRDRAGQVSTIAQDAIKLDTARPSGTVLINGGAASTTSTSVTLTLAASDPAPASGVFKMRFKNESAGTWSSWQTYSTSKSWTLSAGAGTKTVYVQYKDRAGNISAAARDTISYSP